MKTITLAMLVLLTIPTICVAQNQNYNKKYLLDSIDVIQKRVEKLIIPSRYMEKKIISKTDTIKGWEGIEVALY